MLWSKGKKMHISRNVVFFEEEPYYKMSEEEHNILSPLNECLLSLTTNQERQIVMIENRGSQNNFGRNQEEGIQDETRSEMMEETQEREMTLRRSNRQPQPSIRLKNYVTYLVKYPIQDYILYKNVSHNHYTFITALSKIEEPTNYEMARTNPNWCKIMRDELYALEKKIKFGNFVTC
jgi:NADH dehydrogenase/NADH:ubiquinone oxidoreductase subunit G